MCLTCKMTLLSDHEVLTSEGPLCPKCGRLRVPEEELSENPRCFHCCREGFGQESCPVCEDEEIPAVFFDADMTDELVRLSALRALYR